MFCILLTSLIFLSYYYLLTACIANGKSGVDKILFPFLMTSAQILSTELILGLSGILYPLLLAVVNGAAAILTLVFSSNKDRNFRLTDQIVKDLGSARSFIGNSTDSFNIILLAIVLLTYAWILAASYFLPLRGVDDLFYHLPPIFHYIQTHEISLLPLGIRPHFAYPQNAELFQMWPLIFSKNVTMLDAVNVPFVIVSVVVVHALLRSAGVLVKHALFLSLLYALTPVVIMQAGSNYIDIMVGLFLLLGIYYTVRYTQEPQALYACCAATAIGIVCGMKYTAFFLTVPLQIVMIWKLISTGKRHLKLYASLLTLLCCWWYIRNIAVLGNPFYPMNIKASGMGFMAGGSHGITADIAVNIRSWFLQFPIDDIGLGSYDGGFGLIFWGVGFPSWVLLCIHELLHRGRPLLVRSIPCLYLPLGFLMLLAIPNKELVYSGRMALFIVAVGLYAIGAVMMMIHEKVYISLLKVVCIVFSLFVMSLLSQSTMPSYRLDKPLADKRNGQQPSEYRYVAASNEVYPLLSDFWEPLDLLTRDDNPGLNCYIASHPGLVALAPLYGSRLQNRVLNLGENKGSRAEALLYLAYPDRYDFGRFIKSQISYYGYRMPLGDVLAKGEHLVVTTNELGSFLLDRQFCIKPVKREMLRTFYKERWPNEVEAARTLQPFLHKGIPVITSHPLAYGLRAIGDEDALDNITLTQNGYEQFIAEKRRLQNFYSLDSPVDGYASMKVTTIMYRDQTIEVYLNKL